MHDRVIDCPNLSLLRLHLTMRFHGDTVLPAYKGAMLRGGLGYSLQRVACSPDCWDKTTPCYRGSHCPFQVIFASFHPQDIAHLQGLRDIPRPFLIEVQDRQTHYKAGDILEFDLILIGKCVDFLSYFLIAFDLFGRTGLGRLRTPARLECVKAVSERTRADSVIYQDGCITTDISSLPYTSLSVIAQHARTLPDTLRLTITTPLRVKTNGVFMQQFNPVAFVQAACWRIHALATFYGDGPWNYPYRHLVDMAHAITIEDVQLRWVDWTRTSTRGGKAKKMTLGGLVGTLGLRHVPPEVRSVLCMASWLHTGKATSFGYGAFNLEAES